MTNDARRLKHLEVTPELFVDLLKDGNEIRVDVTDGLPDDAEFRRIEYDFDRDVYWLIVWSSAFDALAEGEPIPGTTVELTDVMGDGAFRTDHPDAEDRERPARDPDALVWFDADAPRTLVNKLVNLDIGCAPAVEYVAADYDPADYPDATVDADDLVDELEGDE